MKLAPHALLEEAAQATILDVRDEPAFRAGHLAGAGHIPRTELRARRSELPPRDARLIVVADSATEARAAAEALETLGYAEPGWLDAALEQVPGGIATRGAPRQLWRPAPFLEQVLPRLLAALPRGARALDLAAGAGREAVFLAMHGFTVEAWDHDRDILARASAMAARHGVSITIAARNLERRDPELPIATHRLVTVFRFLHRPLFPHLERAIAPGGFLVYETYRRGQARLGRPKHPRFLLDDGELERAFPALVVEHYEESNPPQGPITARLLARRPA